MTADDLRVWQKALQLTYDTAAEELDMHRATYARYLKHEGELPRWLGLACAAVRAGMQPYSPSAADRQSASTFKRRLNGPVA